MTCLQPFLSIIAHRGYWHNVSEKNTAIAFRRALENGFGIEADFRDHNGELVISHDIPINGVMKSSEFIDLYWKYRTSAPMAINIKSDGLHGLIKEFISQSRFISVFVFDMSVPDMCGYLKQNIPTFTRLSEHELKPAFFDDSKGIWLDAFEAEWYCPETIDSLLKKNKHVAIVSPELHGRPHIPLWDLIRRNDFHRNSLISICTDLPMHAKDFFYD